MEKPVCQCLSDSVSNFVDFNHLHRGKLVNLEEARCGRDHRRHIKDGQDVATVMPFIHLQTLEECFCCNHLAFLMANCEIK